MSTEQPEAKRHKGLMHSPNQPPSTHTQHHVRPVSSVSINSHSDHFDFREERDRKKESRADKIRISELLARNLTNELIGLEIKGEEAMHGDLPALGLHPSFFVEGVKIGWPFPSVMLPQRQMAIHLIKALKNKRHVVLESPTGTGKSAAILCSALAWQRYHRKVQGSSSTVNIADLIPFESRNKKGKTPKIIYCSRTHSQVSQMVSSLRKTPYRPRMAVLGSRDRMCIHSAIRSEARHKLTQGCISRVKNTDGQRAALHRSGRGYNDDDPPVGFENDNAMDVDQQRQLDAAPSGEEEKGESEVHVSERSSRRTGKPLCPHYRQLGARRTTKMVVERFIPAPARVNCCTAGGEKTLMGSHDIEDLVAFSKDPHRNRGVAIYRHADKPQFGMNVAKDNGLATPMQVRELKEGFPAIEEGTIRPGDYILAVNGESVLNVNLKQGLSMMSETPQEKPLMLEVTADPDMVNSGEDEGDTSPHSPCPYYLSRALAKHADLIFAPYNYVLDPFIRDALDISIENNIVILDEAHNVEGVLRESGSGTYSEFELCEIVSMLTYFSNKEKNSDEMIKLSRDETEAIDPEDLPFEEISCGRVAHNLLLFFEQLAYFLIDSKATFEKKANGAQKALDDWRRKFVNDDSEFEMTFDGPTGSGARGKPVGCGSFFSKLSCDIKKLEALRPEAEAFDTFLRKNDNYATTYSTTSDKVQDIVWKFSHAARAPEHYYISTVSKANGSMAFAAGTVNNTAGATQRKPKRLPLLHPRTPDHPEIPAHPCLHPECRNVKDGHRLVNGLVRHGHFCNGNTPSWESFLVIQLLTPAKFMEPLAEQCHSVVLASGSLAPIPSLCGELGLTAEMRLTEHHGSARKPLMNPTEDESDIVEKPNPARLQVVPKPLEADHVINLEKQLLAVSVGVFSDGTPITINHKNWKRPDFIPKLGDAIASVIESVPYGGVLVFFPSYSFLRKCVNQWNPSSFFGRQARFNPENPYDRIIRSKGKIIVEPSGSQTHFEEAREEYSEAIKLSRNCVLFAVFRGKMSEGISFNDDNARCVICLGIPYPSVFARDVDSKRKYNDEQRLLRKRTELLSGMQWYSQQAYRAIAQALGRCIRHSGDYGAIILMDSRHCDDGSPVDGICHAHRQLPKWMRGHVRNLSRWSRGSGFDTSNLVLGGWQGLQAEMSSFFQSAPHYANTVLSKQMEDFEKARVSRREGTPKFDSTTGDWKTGNEEVRSTVKTEVKVSSSSVVSPDNPTSAAHATMREALK